MLPDASIDRIATNRAAPPILALCIVRGGAGCGPAIRRARPRWPTAIGPRETKIS